MKLLRKLRKNLSLAWPLPLVVCVGCVKTSYIGGTYFESGTVTGVAIVNGQRVDMTLNVDNSFVVDENTMEQMLTQ